MSDEDAISISTRSWMIKILTSIDANVKKTVRQLDQKMRLRTMEKGIIASSPLKYSQIRNTNAVAAPPQKSPMTVEEFHEY